MQGKTHVGFALAGSVTLNNATYVVLPHPLPGAFDDFFHALGQPLTIAQVAHLWQAHQQVNAAIASSLAHKLTFFLILILCARLPDRLERKRGVEARTLSDEVALPVKHRGFTHSCFLLFLLTFLFLGLCAFAWTYFQHHPLVLSPVMNDLLVKEVYAAFLGLLFAWFLHIVADSLTTQGVKVFWPDESYYGLLPRSLRFSNDTWPEYIVLWSFIFVIGGLIFLGIFGI